jgi:hypothetical protein
MGGGSEGEAITATCPCLTLGSQCSLGGALLAL